MSPQRIENSARRLRDPAIVWTIRMAPLLSLLICGLAVLRPVEAAAQTPAQGQGPAQGGESGSLELVDPNVFRACGDPRNLPFSNDKSEGFENKLANCSRQNSARSSATPTSRKPPGLCG
jgi:hypothetical protein